MATQDDHDALATLLLWHFYKHPNKIRKSARERAESNNMSNLGIKPSVPGSFAYSADIPGYVHSSNPTYQEWARPVAIYLSNPHAGQEASEKFFSAAVQYLRSNVITNEYRTLTPPYIRSCVDKLFYSMPAEGKTQSVAIQKAPHTPASLMADLAETNSGDRRVEASFNGLWHLVRYSHDGKRLIKQAMAVNADGQSTATTVHYFRGNNHADGMKRETHGAMMTLKKGEHVFFIAQDNNADPAEKGYPITLICPASISGQKAFVGLMMRRHHRVRSAIISMRVLFVRVTGYAKLEDIPLERIGSWPHPERSLEHCRTDIPDIEELLKELDSEAPPPHGAITIGLNS